MKPSVLVTGASSYLAHRLIPIAAEFGHVFGVSRHASSVECQAIPVEFDLANALEIEHLIEKVQPEIIIHAAAVNPGDGDKLMDAVNHVATGRLAEVAAAMDIRYVMVSTESVHSGLRAPYGDDAVPDPINTYGQSKAAGEQAALAVNPAAAVVRTSLIYGLEKIDRGTRGFRDRLLRGEQLELFDDVYRQPIWADSLSRALCNLAFVDTGVSGTLNVVGEETMSRADFGLAMLKYWGVDPGERVSFRSGAQLQGVQMDLTCSCELADALGYSRPGVTEVLGYLNSGARRQRS